MRFLISACLMIILTAGSASAGRVANETFKGKITKEVNYRYAIHLPDGYDKPDNKTKYPLILFLHGAEYRGDNLDKIADLGPMHYARTHPDFHFIVVAPQCPLHTYWKPDELNAFLDGIESKYRVQKSAVYLTGYSMGGAGTWALAMDHHERFAAIAPLCGRNIPLMCGNLWQTPVWVFHGDKDDVVPFVQSEEIVGYLKGMGNKNVKFKVFEGRGHDIWPDVYGNSELYSWFMEFRKERK